MRFRRGKGLAVVVAAAIVQQRGAAVDTAAVGCCVAVVARLARSSHRSIFSSTYIGCW